MLDRNMSVRGLRTVEPSHVLAKGTYSQSLDDRIRVIVKESCWFKNVPDIGMDRYLVSKGEPLATSGLGPCFAVCMIGKTSSRTDVLGLCHMSSFSPIQLVIPKLKDIMVQQEGAVRESIETYVVGGEIKSKGHPGTIREEREFLSLAERENIKGVLFNLSWDEEGICVVLTPRNVLVSKKDLFQPTGEEEGSEIASDSESDL